MNILKKLRGREEEGEPTIKKETNVLSKRMSTIGSEVKHSNENVFYLIDYEFREESVWCVMTKSLKDPSEVPKTVWVAKAPSRLILKREYVLVNFQDVQVSHSSDFLNTAAGCFADEMILC